MKYRRLQTLGFAALLATLTAIHCLPTEAQADRRRRWTTYGSDLGRLVVACDMRSDTCSDGRQITTTRSTPVPCEVSPGVWEMVPEDTACISWRGLESWASNTSYLSYGAELNRSPWYRFEATVTALDPGWRICGPPNRGVYQASAIGEAAEGDWRSLTAIARANSNVWLRLNSGEVAGFFRVGTAWEQVTHSVQVSSSASTQISIYNGINEGCIDVLASWLTKTATPGRACWGGEAPVTCEADRHTISTDGWPTESGEICLTYEDSGGVTTRVLIEGRPNSGSGSGTYLWITSGSYELDIAGHKIRSKPGSVVVGQPVRVCIGRKAGDGYISVNGLRHNSGPMPPFEWEPISSIGRGRVSQYQGINGSIRSLTVRSFEEVSP